MGKRFSNLNFCFFCFCKLLSFCTALHWRTQLQFQLLANHRIIEWTGLEGTFMIIQFQPHCYMQGHLPLDKIAQRPIQPGIECIQKGGIHNSLGNLFLYLTTLTVKNFFPISSPNLPSSILKPFPLVLLLHVLTKSPSPVAPRSYWEVLLGLPKAVSTSCWASPALLDSPHRANALTPII